MFQISVIFNAMRRQESCLLRIDLRRHARANLIFAQLVAAHNARDAILIRRNDQHAGFRLAVVACLKEQRNHVNNDLAILCMLLFLIRKLAHKRMHDCIQLFARIRVSEDDLGQRATVQPATSHHPGPHSGNRPQAVAVWRHRLPR